MEIENQQVPKPKWTRNTPLSPLHGDWKEELYKEKMASKVDKESIFVCKRLVQLFAFRALGVVECFERLGWEVVLVFHDPDQVGRIPNRSIVNWMTTLERHMGDNPPRTMSLTGRVGKKEVVMSFDTIRQVAPFDSTGGGVKLRYLDAEQHRHYTDFYTGRQYVSHPEPVEWSQVGQYNGEAQYPYPETHYSRWVPLPYQHQGPSGSSSGPSDDFSAISDSLMTGWFGQEIPRPLADDPYEEPELNHRDTR
ncbi:hypothetical protein L1987_01137 [Smallanthus sonchifolius]|uniref:Uncharacterized protein n=1 Tax=Smallanthus sonchifolius TaxID=185202 RepID=A0ACB9K4F3_9ASTR|nr:hypothetical protein L1987_01137 [Smallanthus sonchifolius]